MIKIQVPLLAHLHKENYRNLFILSMFAVIYHLNN